LQDQRDLMGMTNEDGEDIEDYDAGVFLKKKGSKLIKVKKHVSH